jgi:hypothetical protein
MLHIGCAYAYPRAPHQLSPFFPGTKAVMGDTGVGDIQYAITGLEYAVREVAIFI